MDVNTIVGLIGTLGFPIVACGVMAYFIFHMIKKNNEFNVKNMEQIQLRCKEREDKLYNFLEESKEVNSKALATIALYAERLGVIEQDVKEIKSDIIILTEHAK